MADPPGYGFRPMFTSSNPTSIENYYPTGHTSLISSNPTSIENYYPTGHTSLANTSEPNNIQTNLCVNHQSPQKGYYWRQWHSGQIVPSTAVRGGTDIDGSAIYVGRAHHAGDLIPAKAIPEKNVAYICYDGEEIAVDSCEIMCQPLLEWVPSYHGQVPPGAISVGHTADGEPLYAGRVYHEGSHTVGKVHPSHGSCYIPFDGKEVPYKQYETLTQKHDY